MGCDAVSFCELGDFILLLSGRIIPKIGEPLTPWCFGTVLIPLGVSCSLQIEDQGLIELDLSSWTHLT